MHAADPVDRRATRRSAQGLRDQRTPIAPAGAATSASSCGGERALAGSHNLTGAGSRIECTAAELAAADDSTWSQIGAFLGIALALLAATGWPIEWLAAAVGG